MSKYPPIGLDDRLRFGKHKGKELWQVLEEDLDYVGWMIDQDIAITNEAYEAYSKRKDGDPRW